MRLILICYVLSAVVSVPVFAAPPPPTEPNCLAVYNACTSGGYIQGDAGKGNGLWKDCINPLMTGSTPPKPPPAGVTFPSAASLSQQIQTCHKNHPKFGMH